MLFSYMYVAFYKARHRLMQEYLWVHGGDTLIRPSYIQTSFWATLYNEIWQHALDIMQYQCWIMDFFLIQYKISQLSRLMHILQIAGGMLFSFAMSVCTHFDNLRLISAVIYILMHNNEWMNNLDTLLSWIADPKARIK